jgi:Uma2 family endonuclease
MLQTVTRSKDTRRRATYQDLLNVPAPLVAEIVDGVLYASPRPASRQALAHTNLIAELGPFREGSDGPGGWWILTEPELHFGEDILVPDIAAWRVARMPVVPDVAWFTLAPDWICEVLSPSTERVDRSDKLRVYANAGIASAWLIDPVARRLEVLVRRGAGWTRRGNYEMNDRARVAPFDAIEMPLSRL